MIYLIKQYDHPKTAIPKTIGTVDYHATDIQKHIDDIHRENPAVFCIEAWPEQHPANWYRYSTNCDAQKFNWERYFEMHPDDPDQLINIECQRRARCIPPIDNRLSDYLSTRPDLIASHLNP